MAYPGKKSETPAKTISPRTVHHVFSTLRTAMHDALDDGAITVHPFAKRMSPKKGLAEISALDETQIVALLDYLDGTVLGPATRLAIYTGMRRGELLGLTWDAIDLDNRVLRGASITRGDRHRKRTRGSFQGAEDREEPTRRRVDFRRDRGLTRAAGAAIEAAASPERPIW